MNDAPSPRHAERRLHLFGAAPGRAQRDRDERAHELGLYLACAMLFVVALIDKGIGTIVLGFVPEPWGRIATHSPTWVELTVSAGPWTN